MKGRSGAFDPRENFLTREFFQASSRKTSSLRFLFIHSSAAQGDDAVKRRVLELAEGVLLAFQSKASPTEARDQLANDYWSVPLS
jgi:hypothetical protein